MPSTVLNRTEAACWIWQALWTERKRRQKRQKQREENGEKYWDTAAAPKPMQFRLLDAVIFDRSGPALGIFTSRQGELMRRTAASLDPTIVRGRLAQLALGVFNGGGGLSGIGSSPTVTNPPIGVAYLVDGSRLEVSSSDWERLVMSGARNGTVRALTAWAAPSSEDGDGKAGAGVMRLRNSYRVATEGSQIGKIKTATHRVMAKHSVQQLHARAAAYAAGNSVGNKPHYIEQQQQQQLVPSRAAELNSQLDALTLQLVRLVEGAYGRKRGLRLRRVTVDFVVQTNAAGGSSGADTGEALGRTKKQGSRNSKPGSGHGFRGNGEDNDEPSALSGGHVVWLERCVEVEIHEEERRHDDDDGDDDDEEEENEKGGGSGDTRKGAKATASSGSLPPLATTLGLAAAVGCVEGREAKKRGEKAGKQQQRPHSSSEQQKAKRQRPCAGDFCRFDPLDEQGVMDGGESVPTTSSSSQRQGIATAVALKGGAEDKVVTYRSVVTARSEGTALLRSVAEAFSSGQRKANARGFGGGDTEAALELRAGLEEKGWSPSLAHWWLRARVGLPLPSAAAAANSHGNLRSPRPSSSSSLSSSPIVVVPHRPPGLPPGYVSPSKPPPHLSPQAAPAASASYYEPKALLVTGPCEVPPECWWPGRLVEITWASAGPVKTVSVWLQGVNHKSKRSRRQQQQGDIFDGDDGGSGGGLSALSVAVAPRAPNTGKLVCVLPASLTARLLATTGDGGDNPTKVSKLEEQFPNVAAGASSAGGTVGWPFKVRVCDAMDPDVEAFSAPVVVVASDKAVSEGDRRQQRQPKPKEQVAFEERVRQRRVLEWRTALVSAETPQQHVGTGAQMSETRAKHASALAAAHNAAATSGGASYKHNGGGGGGGGSPTPRQQQQQQPARGLVSVLCSLNLEEGSELAAATKTNHIDRSGGHNKAAAPVSLSQLYGEVRVCAQCYQVYKELDARRHDAREREACELKKTKQRQRLVKEQVRLEQQQQQQQQQQRQDDDNSGGQQQRRGSAQMGARGGLPPPRGSGGGGGGGDHNGDDNGDFNAEARAAVSLPLIAQALSNQQRAVTERLARPRPSEKDAYNGEGRSKSQGNNVLPAVPGASSSSSSNTKNSAGGSAAAHKAYHRPVWQQVKGSGDVHEESSLEELMPLGLSGERGFEKAGEVDHAQAVEGHGGASSSFVRNIGKRAARAAQENSELVAKANARVAANKLGPPNPLLLRNGDDGDNSQFVMVDGERGSSGGSCDGGEDDNGDQRARRRRRAAKAALSTAVVVLGAAPSYASSSSIALKRHAGHAVMDQLVGKGRRAAAAAQEAKLAQENSGGIASVGVGGSAGRGGASAAAKEGAFHGGGTQQHGQQQADTHPSLQVEYPSLQRLPPRRKRKAPPKKSSDPDPMRFMHGHQRELELERRRRDALVAKTKGMGLELSEKEIDELFDTTATAATTATATAAVPRRGGAGESSKNRCIDSRRRQPQQQQQQQQRGALAANKHRQGNIESGSADQGRAKKRGGGGTGGSNSKVKAAGAGSHRESSRNVGDRSSNSSRSSAGVKTKTKKVGAATGHRQDGSNLIDDGGGSGGGDDGNWDDFLRQNEEAKQREGSGAESDDDDDESQEDIGFGEDGGPSTLQKDEWESEKDVAAVAAAAALRRRGRMPPPQASGGAGEGGCGSSDGGDGSEEGRPSALSKWEQRWGSSGGGGDDSDDDEDEEERTLPEYHELQRFKATMDENCATEKTNKSSLQQQRRRREEEDKAAAATAGTKATAASAAAAIAAASGDPAELARVLEALARQARAAVGHEEGQLSPPQQQAQQQQQAHAQPLRKTKTPPPAPRCAHCSLLPVARRCLDCPISGCAVCWAKEHARVGKAKRGHRFEVVGPARAQAAALLAEAEAFADDMDRQRKDAAANAKAAGGGSGGGAGLLASTLMAGTGDTELLRTLGADEASATRQRQTRGPSPPHQSSANSQLTPAVERAVAQGAPHLASPASPMQQLFSDEDRLVKAGLAALPQPSSNAKPSELDRSSLKPWAAQLQPSSSLAKEDHDVKASLSSSSSSSGDSGIKNKANAKANNATAVAAASKRSIFHRPPPLEVPLVPAPQRKKQQQQPPTDAGVHGDAANRHRNFGQDSDEDEGDDEEEDEDGILPPLTSAVTAASSVAGGGGWGGVGFNPGTRQDRVEGYGDDDDDDDDDEDDDDEDDDDDDDEDGIGWTPTTQDAVKTRAPPLVNTSTPKVSGMVHNRLSGSSQKKKGSDDDDDDDDDDDEKVNDREDTGGNGYGGEEELTAVELLQKDHKRDQEALVQSLEVEATRQALSLKQRLEDKKRGRAESRKGSRLRHASPPSSASRPESAAAAAASSPSGGPEKGSGRVSPLAAAASPTAAGMSSEWALREWESAQADRSAQAVALEEERKRQQRLTQEKRASSRQGSAASRVRALRSSQGGESASRGGGGGGRSLSPGSAGGFGSRLLDT